jgi:hypothetical protein
MPSIDTYMYHMYRWFEQSDEYHKITCTEHAVARGQDKSSPTAESAFEFIQLLQSFRIAWRLQTGTWIPKSTR